MSNFSGGYFGLGWTRDLWRIPEYVRDANNESDYMTRLAEKMSKSEKPPFSVSSDLILISRCPQT